MLEKIVLGMVLLIFSVQDLKNRTINIIYMLIVIPFIIWNIFKGKMDFSLVIGGIIFGVVFVLLSIIAKGQIGIGDALVLCLNGLVLGFWDSIGVLFTGMFIAAVFSLAGIVLKKFGRKTKLPLMPFLFAGYLIVNLLKV